VGAALGVVVFNYLKALGQVDLLVRLCYVVFLGVIGALMFVESLNAIRKTRSRRRAQAQASAAGSMPCPSRCGSAPRGFTSRVIPPLLVGVCVGILAAIMGVGGGFIMVPGDDLPPGHADQGGGGHLAVPDHLRHRLHHAAARHHELHRRHGAGGAAC
jgi:uncharacterized membrane protein YfcA